MDKRLRSQGERRRGRLVRSNVRAEAGPTAKRQARAVENARAHCASPLRGPGVLMLGLASSAGLGVTRDFGDSESVLGGPLQ